MIAIEHLDLIARQPPGVTGPQRLDHRLGESRRVSHEGSGYPRFDAIELVIEGGSRHPKRVFLGLIGCMYGRMDPEDDLTHEVHQGGKQ
jgi:hypothetical protein